MKTQEQKCANTVQANTYGHKYTKTLEQKYANTVQAYVDTNIRRRKNKKYTNTVQAYGYKYARAAKTNTVQAHGYKYTNTQEQKTQIQ